MGNQQVFPGFSVVGGGKGCGIGAVPLCSGGFLQNFPAVEFVGGFCFDHIDGIGGFNNKVGFVAFCVVLPVDPELVGSRAEPFEYLGVVFQHKSKLFFGF